MRYPLETAKSLNSVIASSGGDSVKLVLHDLNLELEKAGITGRGGSIVDATFIEAPSATKNKDHARDP